MLKIELIKSTWPPVSGKHIHSLIFIHNNWDDFGYSTLFQLFYCDSNGKPHEIGYIKIYSNKQDELGSSKKILTYLKFGEINQLDKSFCSLGQSPNFYRNLILHCSREWELVLKRLNDMATNKDIKRDFIEQEGVKVSLLRDSGAQKALEEAERIVHGRIFDNDMSFSYCCPLYKSENKINIAFDFKKDDFFPHRINVVVGKNGTGKTTLLANLAKDIQSYGSSFISKTATFHKIITISYSAFDKFYVPGLDEKEDKDSNKKNSKVKDENNRSLFDYLYCGLRTPKGLLTEKEKIKLLAEAYKKVKDKNRELKWKEIVKQVISYDIDRIINEIEFYDIFEKQRVPLSSGQQIILLTLTEIIGEIEEESLILFDEPELYLHPNAISSLMNAYTALLDYFNSYAIFATHSPLILQEIPSKYIHVLRRIDDNILVNSPTMECFGANISSIIYDVFFVSDSESNYKSFFKRQSKKTSYDEICHKFGNNLDLEALLFLHNCCNTGRK